MSQSAWDKRNFAIGRPFSGFFLILLLATFVVQSSDCWSHSSREWRTENTGLRLNRFEAKALQESRDSIRQENPTAYRSLSVDRRDVQRIRNDLSRDEPRKNRDSKRFSSTFRNNDENRARIADSRTEDLLINQRRDTIHRSDYDRRNSRHLSESGRTQSNRALEEPLKRNNIRDDSTEGTRRVSLRQRADILRQQTRRHAAEGSSADRRSIAHERQNEQDATRKTLSRSSRDGSIRRERDEPMSCLRERFETHVRESRSRNVNRRALEPYRSRVFTQESNRVVEDITQTRLSRERQIEERVRSWESSLRRDSRDNSENRRQNRDRVSESQTNTRSRDAVYRRQREIRETRVNARNSGMNTRDERENLVTASLRLVKRQIHQNYMNPTESVRKARSLPSSTSSNREKTTSSSNNRQEVNSRASHGNKRNSLKEERQSRLTRETIRNTAQVRGNREIRSRTQVLAREFMETSRVATLSSRRLSEQSSLRRVDSERTPNEINQMRRQISDNRNENQVVRNDISRQQRNERANRVQTSIIDRRVTIEQTIRDNNSAQRRNRMSTRDNNLQKVQANDRRSERSQRMRDNTRQERYDRLVLSRAVRSDERTEFSRTYIRQRTNSNQREITTERNSDSRSRERSLERAQEMRTTSNLNNQSRRMADSRGSRTQALRTSRDRLQSRSNSRNEFQNSRTDRQGSMIQTIRADTRRDVRILEMSERTSRVEEKLFADIKKVEFFDSEFVGDLLKSIPYRMKDTANLNNRNNRWSLGNLSVSIVACAASYLLMDLPIFSGKKGVEAY